MFVFANIVNFVKHSNRHAAATVSNDMLSAPTLPLHCAYILQPATPPHAVVLGPSVLQFVSTACHRESISLLLNHRNLIFETACVLTPFSSAFAFPIEMTSALSLSFQFGHHHHSDSSITFT